MDGYVTTPEAAEILGVTPRRVLALIQAGKLPSQQFGRDHIIKRADLALVAERKTGRPRKQEATAAPTKKGKAGFIKAPRK